MLMIRRVVGYSMLPGYPPGDLVVGRRIFKKLKLNQVVVLRHDGKEKIKRIKQIKDGLIYVLGDNLDGSSDSRQFGWIDHKTVLAVVIWPKRQKGTGPKIL